jgi:L-cystine uptake protein TcyP (sodium:dicarboxylate symporter family)
MSIKVGMRKPIYPEWVNDAISKLSAENKDSIVKCVIYTIMSKTDKGIAIHKVLQEMSNRIPTLRSIEDALVALMIAEPMMFFHTSQKRGDKTEYEN